MTILLASSTSAACHVPERDLPLLIEFSAPSALRRERERSSGLPIVGNGPPGTFVVFSSGWRVSLPTDQIVHAEDADGFARVGFGGMRYVGVESGYVIFSRVHEMFPEALLSPDRSHAMRLELRWVAVVFTRGEEVWRRDASPPTRTHV